MKLLLDTAALSRRRAIAAGSLAPLAASLAGDLDALLEREVYFPPEKALLSRQGGRCAADGALLEFDPFNRREHRCPVCGRVYTGELHERFWIYWYQLWLAERAVHAAALTALGVTDRFRPLAVEILGGYADRYAGYPNRDNVLGPTRLFFSTYLESIWLLQICVATDLLAESEPGLADRVRAEIIAPSRSIIAEYDEGESNRQVWNDVALLAASRLLGDERGAESALYGRSGLVSHLARGLLPDGTWYEGENYHLFAHRGLWYGVTMAERAGLAIDAPLVERFQRGFDAPFATALPDFTLPSRRDSQYAISLRQWRIAEHCELGVARVLDPVLLGALHRMYDDDVPRAATGRDRSSADAERNAPPSKLSRADLSWRALLFALPELPAGDAEPPRSALLDGQGIAVFRRESGQVYVALDYGHSGGGHGHPDRLNVLLADGSTRWLNDFGTGSYVDPSLHWYRSTLAHNAPLIDGKSQKPVDGALLAFDERGAAGWIVARVAGTAPGATIERSLIVLPTYAIDIIDWDAPDAATVDLPLHADLEIASGATPLAPAPLTGGSGLEDGFAFTRDAARQEVAAESTVVAHARRGARTLDVFATSTSDTEWWRATAPGAPSHGDESFRIIRTAAPRGEHRIIWSWAGDVSSADFGDGIRLAMADGTVHHHRKIDDTWHIDLLAGGARSSIDLTGSVPAPAPAPAPPPASAPAPARVLTLPLGGRSLLIELGERHYRRSEESWRDAGNPSASVTLRWTGRALDVTIELPRSDLTFAAADATNIYDNEPPDVNGDGVQLYIRTDTADATTLGWSLVPERDSTAVRQRRLDRGDPLHLLEARWEPLGDGYVMHVSIPGPVPPAAFDVIINEMPRGRQRRRGQLVMSGADAAPTGAGGFVYLRGDRHDPERLIALRLADD
jgi:hypothetical protein